MIPAGSGVIRSSWSCLKPVEVSQVLMCCGGSMLGPSLRKRNISAFAQLTLWFKPVLEMTEATRPRGAVLLLSLCVRQRQENFGLGSPAWKCCQFLGDPGPAFYRPSLLWPHGDWSASAEMNSVTELRPAKWSSAL